MAPAGSLSYTHAVINTAFITCHLQPIKLLVFTMSCTMCRSPVDKVTDEVDARPGNPPGSAGRKLSLQHLQKVNKVDTTNRCEALKEVMS